MTRILVVDDEPQLLRALGTNLKARDYEVDLAPTGELALTLAARNHPDLVVLDLGLPGIDGIEVIQGLRGWTQVPIIVLSVREGERDKVAALDAGADDYVTKPFGMDELLARLRAALRRAAPADETAEVVTPDFTVDLAAKRVTNAAGDVRLTPTEWEIVEILVRNPGKLITQRQLLREVWGPQYSTETNYLRVYMAQIRRKLEPDPSRPRSFHTEARMGYRFDPPSRDGFQTKRDPPRGRVSDGAEGARTPDLLAASQTLSQLSYGPGNRDCRCSFRRPRGSLELRHVVPEILEPVAPPGFVGEDVQDRVEVVRDDPGPFALAGDGARQELVVALHREMHLVADRLRLPRVAARSR